MTKPHKLSRFLGHFGFTLTLSIATLWAATALSLNLTGGTRILALLVLGLACAASLGLRLYKRRAAWGTFAVAALATGVWYQTVTPSQDRDWAPDVAHGISAEINGPIATLHNIRNFAWTSDSLAIPVWQSHSYNMDQITSVDMITSTWGNPDIAHLIVSFGFQTGEHIAFSVEIRREKTELFSTIGGFFRQFELVLIAAEESDVIKVRTNFRGEDVHLYPLALTPEHRRDLFLTYLDLGNRLAAKPEFYNTVTANCTSTVYSLVKAIKPEIPLDTSLLLSGNLPEYIDSLGGLSGDMPMSQRRASSAISAKALSGNTADFSALIRNN